MIVFAFPEHQALAASLITEQGIWQWRHFPDGESYVRVCSDVKDRQVAILCSLNQPDAKTLPMIFLAATLKRLGATKITLIAPYLAYMRQDKEFNVGEAVTSQVFAPLLSHYVDVLVTIDPHLHRYDSLSEVYSCECKTLSAAPLMAEWIKANVSKPLIIGPDAESEQWVGQVAAQVGAPHLVLEKTRHSDRDVTINLPQMSAFKGYSPVLVDDIISTAGTMIKTLSLLHAESFVEATCLATHALFAGDAYDALQKAGAGRVVTSNTILHPSNGMDIASLLIKL